MKQELPIWRRKGRAEGEEERTGKNLLEGEVHFNSTIFESTFYTLCALLQMPNLLDTNITINIKQIPKLCIHYRLPRLQLFFRCLELRTGVILIGAVHLVRIRVKTIMNDNNGAQHFIRFILIGALHLVMMIILMLIMDDNDIKMIMQISQQAISSLFLLFLLLLLMSGQVRAIKWILKFSILKAGSRPSEWVDSKEAHFSQRRQLKSCRGDEWG